MNGSDAVSDDDINNPNVIDYYFLKDRIEIGITNSVAQNAMDDLLAEDKRYNLSVYDPQDGSVYFRV